MYYILYYIKIIIIIDIIAGNNTLEKNCKEIFLSSFVCEQERNAVISYRSACRPVTAVPDVERLVERLQHGLQYDRHTGARLQEDQLLPDDPLRGDTATGLWEGVRRPESHLVSVHTHALRVWGLRALHVAGGAKGRQEKRDAFRICAGGSASAARWIIGKESLLSAKSITKSRSSWQVGSTNVSSRR